tara:strand:+ start:240 stop:491 length:252 start_codon:yes stop_codon:yes gene_type:complete
MELFTITQNNDQEWHTLNVELFLDLKTAVSNWNKKMIFNNSRLWQVSEVEESLKEDGFVLFTYKDTFGRKWATELTKTKITTR